MSYAPQYAVSDGQYWANGKGCIPMPTTEDYYQIRENLDGDGGQVPNSIKVTKKGGGYVDITEGKETITAGIRSVDATRRHRIHKGVYIYIPGLHKLIHVTHFTGHTDNAGTEFVCFLDPAFPITMAAATAYDVRVLGTGAGNVEVENIGGVDGLLAGVNFPAGANKTLLDTPVTYDSTPTVYSFTTFPAV